MQIRRLLSCCISIAFAVMLAPQYVFAQSSERTDAYLNSMNDDDIPFNQDFIEFGSPQAKITAVFFYGITIDSSYFVKRILPGIISKYVDTGIVRLKLVEYPLSLHDIQAFSAFRCVDAKRHWELLQRVAVRDERKGFNLKNANYQNAPEIIWGMMDDFGVDRKKADACMRNTQINGFVEGLRRGGAEAFQVTSAPKLYVGGKLITPDAAGRVRDAIDEALKEVK